MKYHHQNGLVKEKSSSKKWLKVGVGVFLVAAAIGYGAFNYTSPSFAGWPFGRGDEVAASLQKNKPDSVKSVLHVPKLNIAKQLDADDSLSMSGTPASGEAVAIEGKYFSLKPSPWDTRVASPFYRLNELKENDEIYVDHKGVRYVYQIKTGDISPDEEGVLTLAAEGMANVSVNAVPLGVVAWDDNKPRIERPL